MAVDAGFVRKIFAGLEHGEGAAFFEHVAAAVDWIVMVARLFEQNPI